MLKLASEFLYFLIVRHFTKSNRISLYKNPVVTDPYKDFDIEYIKTIDKYYPRYKGKYIFYSIIKEYQLHSSCGMCECGNSIDEAMNIIDNYRYIMGIPTRKIIKIKNN
jgi:hypothetical protein